VRMNTFIYGSILISRDGVSLGRDNVDERREERRNNDQGGGEHVFELMWEFETRMLKQENTRPPFELYRL